MSKRKSFLIILAIICLVMVSTLSVIKAALLHSNGEINSLSGKTTNNPDFTIKEKTETKADNKTKLQRVNEDLLALLKENNINLEGCSSTVVEDLDYILVQVKKEDIETVKNSRRILKRKPEFASRSKSSLRNYLTGMRIPAHLIKQNLS